MPPRTAEMEGLLGDQFPASAGTLRQEIPIKDRQGDADRDSTVGDVDHAANPAVDGCRSKEQVRLLEAPAHGWHQVVDGVEAGLAVGDGGVHVVVAPVLDADALEGDE